MTGNEDVQTVDGCNVMWDSPSVVSEAQEDINNAINVEVEYLKKYPKDKGLFFLSE